MNKKRTLFLVFLLLLLIPGLLNIALSDEQILYSKIKTIEPHEVNGQYCYVKVVMKQEGDTITKEEIWNVLMVKKVQKLQVIGSYLRSFIIEI